MRRFFQDCNSHAVLESFDLAVFTPDDKAPASACELVLTLAVIFNDAKDIGYALTAIQEPPPPGPVCISRLWGQYSGLELHLYRKLFALLHELLAVVREYDDAIQTPVMRSVRSKLSAKSRASWDGLVEASHGRQTKDPWLKSIMLARHKVAAHYDASQILRGYGARFLDVAGTAGRPLLSRGPNMRTSRFYFADAAVQGYMHSVATQDGWEELVSRTHEIFAHLNQAIMDVVTTFVMERGSAFRTERDLNA